MGNPNCLTTHTQKKKSPQYGWQHLHSCTDGVLPSMNILQHSIYYSIAQDHLELGQNYVELSRRYRKEWDLKWGSNGLLHPHWWGSVNRPELEGLLQSQLLWWIQEWLLSSEDYTLTALLRFAGWINNTKPNSSQIPSLINWKIIEYFTWITNCILVGIAYLESLYSSHCCSKRQQNFLFLGRLYSNGRP